MSEIQLIAETPRAGQWNHCFIVAPTGDLSGEVIREVVTAARRSPQGEDYLAVSVEAAQMLSGRTGREILVLTGIEVNRLSDTQRQQVMVQLEQRLADLATLVTEKVDWEQEGKGGLVKRVELVDWENDFSNLPPARKRRLSQSERKRRTNQLMWAGSVIGILLVGIAIWSLKNPDSAKNSESTGSSQQPGNNELPMREDSEAVQQREDSEAVWRITSLMQENLQNPDKLNQILAELRTLPKYPEVETEDMRTQQLALDQQLSTRLQEIIAFRKADEEAVRQIANLMQENLQNPDKLNQILAELRTLPKHPGVETEEMRGQRTGLEQRLFARQQEVIFRKTDEEAIRQITSLMQENLQNPDKLNQILAELRTLPKHPEVETEDMRTQQLALDQQLSKQVEVVSQHHQELQDLIKEYQSKVSTVKCDYLPAYQDHEKRKNCVSSICDRTGVLNNEVLNHLKSYKKGDALDTTLKNWCSLKEKFLEISKVPDEKLYCLSNWKDIQPVRDFIEQLSTQLNNKTLCQKN